MPNTSTEENAQPSPSGQIIAVAVVQFLGSLPFLYVCGISLWGAVWVTHEAARSGFLVFVLGTPICFAVLAIIAAIGLLRLREWARKLTLFLSTAAAFGCAVFIVLHHPKRTYGTPFAVGDPSTTVASVMLLILIPVGIWWWVLLTRAHVRVEFH